MAKGKCWIPESVQDDILELIKQGEKQAYIASLHGVSVSAVSHIARRNGLGRPPNVARVFSKEEYQDMAKSSLEGVSHRELARKYRCSPELIKRTLKKLGIQRHRRII